MRGTTDPVVVWRRPAKSGTHTPLVVLLHGRGADEYDLLDVADRLPHTFAYASLRAPVPLEGGGFTWFENRGIAQPIAKSLSASVAAVRGWLDGTAALESRRCYLFGFSAGMMMASALLLDDPARFAGAVLLSGALASRDAMPPPAGRLQGVPIFYGLGSLDDVIPATLVAEATAYLLEKSGADVTFREYRHAHTISNRELDDIAEWFGQRE